MGGVDHQQVQPAAFAGIALPFGIFTERRDPWILFTRANGIAATLAQGWKLHISARPNSLESTVSTALPVLFDEGCDFKVVADASILSAFNQGMYGIGAIGKAITVYPSQQR